MTIRAPVVLINQSVRETMLFIIQSHRLDQQCNAPTDMYLDGASGLGNLTMPCKYIMFSENLKLSIKPFCFGSLGATRHSDR